jgi:hypothetical protein
VNPIAAARYAEQLLAAGVAGTNTSHGAQDNLYKINRVLEGDPNQTFGMDELLRDADFEEAYAAVAYYTGYPPDREETSDSGCIDPARTATGLLEAGERVRAVAEAGGCFIFATGHPGALLVYYLGLARWVEELGGKTLTVTTQGCYERGVPLDWAGPVAVLGDGASLLHTHSPAPMQDVLAQVDAPALVIADHGFAGAAVAAGVPTVAIMDTNDPALAVVARRGADLTIIPMDDNRPQNSYTTALKVLKMEEQS